jgi:repressor LexA
MTMSFGTRLREQREGLGLTQGELGRLLGVTGSAVGNYETGGSFPKADILYRIFDVLHCQPNILFQDEMTSLGSDQATPEEMEKLIETYRALDGHGREMVELVLDRETARVKAEEARRRAKELWEDEADEFGGHSAPRVIPLYFTPAAAGYISPAFGEDFRYLEVGGDVPLQADFAVNISGDSMEPYLMDGATAYVNRDPIADGDVGIFFLDGDMLCKQYHRDREGNVHLLSLNRARADADRLVSADSSASLTCFGRVMLPHVPRPIQE